MTMTDQSELEKAADLVVNEQELLKLSVEGDHGHQAAADFRIGFRYGHRRGFKAGAEWQSKQVQKHTLTDFRNHVEVIAERNQLKAEIERLSQLINFASGDGWNELPKCREECDELKAEVERLKIDNSIKRCGSCGEHMMSSSGIAYLSKIEDQRDAYRAQCELLIEALEKIRKPNCYAHPQDLVQDRIGTAKRALGVYKAFKKEIEK